METWAPFATLFAQIEPFVRGSVDTIVRALAGYVAPALQWGLIAYAAGRMLMRAINPTGNPLSEMETLLLKGSVALYLAANATAYTGYVRDLLLYGIPNEVNAAIAGATGARPITAELFDEIWNKAWSAGAAIIKNLSWTDLTLAGVVVVYLVIVAISLLAAFVIWLKAFLFLSLLIAIGPLFIGLFVFPALRGLTRGWFASIMANIILQILSVALLAIVLGAETRLVGQIASLYRSGGNVVTQVQLLLGLTMIFLVCGYLAFMLPGLASSITGGFASGSNGSGGGFGGFGGSAGGRSDRPDPQNNDSQNQPHNRDRRFLSQPAPNGPPPLPGRSLSNRGR